MLDYQTEGLEKPSFSPRVRLFLLSCDWKTRKPKYVLAGTVSQC